MKITENETGRVWVRAHYNIIIIMIIVIIDGQQKPVDHHTPITTHPILMVYHAYPCQSAVRSDIIHTSGADARRLPVCVCCVLYIIRTSSRRFRTNHSIIILLLSSKPLIGLFNAQCTRYRIIFYPRPETRNW